MIKVVPYCDEHLETLLPNLRPHDAMVCKLHGGQTSMRATFKALSEVACMNSFVTDSGEVVAIWIFLPKWEGVAQCYAWTGNAVDKMPKEFWRACLRGLESAKEAMGLHRLEAYVRTDHPHGRGWLSRMGFATEGLLRQHDVDKCDAYMMGRVW